MKSETGLDENTAYDTGPSHVTGPAELIEMLQYISVFIAVYIPILHGLCELDDSEHRVDKRYNYLFICSTLIGELLLLSTSYLYIVI